MNDELLEILQEWLLKYCVDSQYIKTYGQITLAGRARANYNLDNNGDHIVLEPINISDVYLQSTPNYTYHSSGRNAEYQSLKKMKLWIRYIGHEAFAKATAIFDCANQTAGNACNFLKSKDVGYNLSKVRNLTMNLNNNELGCAIIECEISFVQSSFAKQNNTLLKGVSFDINDV